jgi:hypothetical protein
MCCIPRSRQERLKEPGAHCNSGNGAEAHEWHGFRAQPCWQQVMAHGVCQRMCVVCMLS